MLHGLWSLLLGIALLIFAPPSAVDAGTAMAESQDPCPIHCRTAALIGVPNACGAWVGLDSSAGSKCEWLHEGCIGVGCSLDIIFMFPAAAGSVTLAPPFPPPCYNHPGVGGNIAVPFVHDFINCDEELLQEATLYAGANGGGGVVCVVDIGGACSKCY